MTYPPHDPQHHQWLTTREVADYLRVNPRTVRALIERGELTAYPLGPRLIRIKADEVLALLPSGDD